MMRAAIVTGSARGNGRAIAQLLLDRGFSVLGVDMMSADFGGQNYTHVLGSVAELGVMTEATAQACAWSNDVSLVNNAGVTFPANAPYSEELWDRTIDVNLKSPFLWCEQFFASVKEGRIHAGSIANVCSLASHRSFPMNPAYVAAKSGLLGLTRFYADVLGKFGLRANSVSPGYIRTEMTATSYADEQKRASRAAQTFLRRWGTPDDVAGVVGFLLSDDAQYVSGVDVPCDGGWLVKGLHEQIDY